MNLEKLLLCGLGFVTSGWIATASGLTYVEAPPTALGEVRAFVPGGQRLHFLADGGLMLHGGFTEVNGEEAIGLVRLQTSGAVDPSFVADAAFPVERVWSGPLLADAAGRVYFGDGDDETGMLSSSLRRLNTDGSLDAGYEVAAYHDIALEGVPSGISRLVRGVDGRMLATGDFNRIGGVSTVCVARLRADGSVDPDFRFTMDGVLGVPEAVPFADGRWLLVLQTSDNSTPYPLYHRKVVRVLANGTLDPTFKPFVFDLVSYSDHPHAFAIDSAGRVVFAEQAPTSGDGYRLRLGRLKTDGSRDTGFTPVLPALDLDSNRFPRTTLWIPPRVGQIVPIEDGRLLCVAAWEDKSYKGVVRVANGGGLSKSDLPGTADDIVLWLARDAVGQWWGEYARAVGARREARIVRVRANGGVDPAFSVSTRAPGEIHRVAARADGSAVVTGSFDEIDGVTLPGVAIVDGEGDLDLVAALQSLPWTRAELVSVLADQSLLLQAPPPYAIITGSGSPFTTATASAPVLVRVSAQGAVQPLQVDEQRGVRARSAWLDAEGRLLVLVPGASYVGPAHSDAIRFASSGAIDTGYRARDGHGAALTRIQAACAGFDGEGSWVFERHAHSYRMYRLVNDGRGVLSVDLDVSRGGNFAGGLEDIAVTPDGVLVAGDFQLLNQVGAPGIARLGFDGVVDPTWGGWLVQSSVVRSVRALENGLLEVTGSLRTPLGEVSGVYLRSDGRPEFNAPGYDEIVSGVGSPSASPDGAWIMQRADAHDPDGAFVRRWKTGPEIEVPIDAPEHPVNEGDTVTLRVSWVGVPVSVSWLRDGRPVGEARGRELSFTVRGEDGGAIFVARLLFEDGSVIHSIPWTLRLGTIGTRMVNGSIRSRGGHGDDVLVVGGVVGGNGRGALLARGLGPALADFDVEQPVSALHASLLRPDGTEVLAPWEYRQWRDYGTHSHESVIAAARESGAYFPELSRNSGNDQMLFPGVAAGAYHLHVQPREGVAAGVMLGELYSAGGDATARRRLWLKNFSGRSRIGAGDTVLVGGFVIEGTQPLRVLVRGVGPGLVDFGLSGASANPRITVYRGGDVVGANDDWSTSPENQGAVAEASAAVGAFPLTVGSGDAAAVLELAPGVYTAVVSPEGAGQEGVALFEIYAMP